MRRGRGGGKSIGWSLALWATSACSGGVRVQPEPVVPVIACTLTGVPFVGVDTATITFDALGTTREHCALTLAAETLRPWPNRSRGPWTVLVTTTPTQATVRLLDSDAARDIIDAGSALLATEELDLSSYAAARANLDVAPLPWDRTYLRVARAQWPVGASAGPDAVRTDARPAEVPDCNASLTDGGADSSKSVASRRVVYDVGDRTARELAERIVALLEVPDATAVGLSATELDGVLRAGDELAYVISVRRTTYCDALRILLENAPWTRSYAVVPLIDTRAHAIAPRVVRP